MTGITSEKFDYLVVGESPGLKASYGDGNAALKGRSSTRLAAAGGRERESQRAALPQSSCGRGVGGASPNEPLFHETSYRRR